jgi:thiol-disulfide isomerase/thioredoxin
MRALPLLLLLAAPALATEYVGELKAEPAPGPPFMVFDLAPVPRAELSMLPAPPAAEDRVFAGSFRLTPDHPELRVILVEPPQGGPWLYADGDLDGRLSAGERFPPGDVLLKLPPPKPSGRPFPVVLRPIPGPPPEGDESRRMKYSRDATVEGPIQIGMMEMLVRYPIDPRTGQVTLKGRIGMDLDDDGVIEPALSAGEVKSDVGDGPPVFRHRDTYLSTASFDPATGRVVVRTHPASDYKQFDLRPGAEIPDFAFTDLEGRQRSFSELRGQVVLLDFWSTWCAPCVMEMPVLRKVQQDLGGRGFVILGMDVDDDLETHRKSVAELDLPWIHATSASVQDIILKRFGVTTYPTHILVDREGLVVSVGDPGQPPLKKEQLAATVEEVVSRKPVVEYAGRLGTEAVPQAGSGMPQKLEPATPEVLAALPVPAAPGESVYAGRMRLLRRSPLEAQLVLVEPPRGAPFLYADTDLDGRLSAAERFELGDHPGLTEGWRAALLRFPVSGGPIRLYPVLLSLNPAVSAQPKDQPRSLLRSRLAYLEGTVPVGGRELKVRYPLSAEAPDVSLREGELGMDLDGDGQFARGISAAESQVPMEDGQPVIFPLGDLYLSTKSVDAASGRIVLRTHSPAEYRRFDLSPGSRLPDFEFTDLEGRRRRLSELQGKVVLIDVWGVWCSGCVAELPNLQKAYEEWRGRGLEILSLDYGDKPWELKGFLEKTKLPWVHATAQSVEDVVRSNLRIWRFPTKILLDRQGRVISVGDPGQPQLHAEHLLKTLEEVFSGTYSSPTSSR